jgi:hypothetical protein
MPLSKKIYWRHEKAHHYLDTTYEFHLHRLANGVWGKVRPHMGGIPLTKNTRWRLQETFRAWFLRIYEEGNDEVVPPVLREQGILCPIVWMEKGSISIIGIEKLVDERWTEVPLREEVEDAASVETSDGNDGRITTEELRGILDETL